MGKNDKFPKIHALLANIYLYFLDKFKILIALVLLIQTRYDVDLVGWDRAEVTTF